MNKYLYFKAHWCPPCKTVTPIMEQVSQSGIPVDVIDVDGRNAMTTKYNVINIPTVLLVNEKGEVLKRLVGINPISTYIESYK